MLGGKTRVWSLPAKHRIRRILGERRERERQLPLAVSLIFSVSGDKCRDRLNCYANTDRRIIPILFPSPSQLISPLQMKSDSMTLLINFRQRAELSQGICTFPWNVSISSYTYWHLTWVRERVWKVQWSDSAGQGPAGEPLLASVGAGLDVVSSV